MYNTHNVRTFNFITRTHHALFTSIHLCFPNFICLTMSLHRTSSHQIMKHTIRTICSETDYVNHYRNFDCPTLLSTSASALYLKRLSRLTTRQPPYLSKNPPSCAILRTQDKMVFIEVNNPINKRWTEVPNIMTTQSPSRTQSPRA